jgi:hypothetical protein
VTIVEKKINKQKDRVQVGEVVLANEKWSDHTAGTKERRCPTPKERLNHRPRTGPPPKAGSFSRGGAPGTEPSRSGQPSIVKKLARRTRRQVAAGQLDKQL